MVNFFIWIFENNTIIKLGLTVEQTKDEIIRELKERDCTNELI
jgi:hypothetical protein